MLKKGLAVAVILLFIGVAFAPSINAVDDPVPDLDCDGILDLTGCEPGEVISGQISVQNVGDPDSLLDWEIESYPDWGVWTFDPNHGENLAPEDGVLTVTVEVVLPEELEDEIYDEIKFVNLENSSDYCCIDVWRRDDIVHLTQEDDATPIEFELQRIRELVQSIDLRKIIVNPDALVDTLEEISSILEEEDVRNYIEKSSEEDCGCAEDSSEFKWFFPVICTLLFPIWFVAIFIFFSSHRMFGAIFAETMAQIGHNLNCFWKLG